MKSPKKNMLELMLVQSNQKKAGDKNNVRKYYDIFK